MTKETFLQAQDIYSRLLRLGAAHSTISGIKESQFAACFGGDLDDTTILSLKHSLLKNLYDRILECERELEIL